MLTTVELNEKSATKRYLENPQIFGNKINLPLNNPMGQKIKEKL